MAPPPAPPDVETFLERLEHPHLDLVQALRKAVLAADRSIEEGVKWNSVSFRTREWFATVHLRAKVGVGLILHLGAKVRELPGGGLEVPDPDGLLEWLAKDRARVSFADARELKARSKALKALLKRWIQHV